MPIYTKNFLDLHCVPLLGLIFNYIYNSRKVLATPLYLEVYVPCQEDEMSCICLIVRIDFASSSDSEVFFVSSYVTFSEFSYTLVFLVLKTIKLFIFYNHLTMTVPDD